MKRKIWVRRTRDGSYFYLGSEGTKPGRFPPFSACHYPYSNVSVKSDKRMEADRVYEVKEIIFKVTKSLNGFTTGLSKTTHGMPHFRISGCYIFLGKKLSNREATSLPQSLPNEYRMIRHQGNVPIAPVSDHYRRLFNRYERNEASREGDQS